MKSPQSKKCLIKKNDIIVQAFTKAISKQLLQYLKQTIKGKLKIYILIFHNNNLFEKIINNFKFEFHWYWDWIWFKIC